jgi:hypothetical protein
VVVLVLVRLLRLLRRELLLVPVLALVVLLLRRELLLVLVLVQLLLVVQLWSCWCGSGCWCGCCFCRGMQACSVHRGGSHAIGRCHTRARGRRARREPRHAHSTPRAPQSPPASVRSLNGGWLSPLRKIVGSSPGGVLKKKPRAKERARFGEDRSSWKLTRRMQTNLAFVPLALCHW